MKPTIPKIIQKPSLVRRLMEANLNKRYLILVEAALLLLLILCIIAYRTI